MSSTCTYSHRRNERGLKQRLATHDIQLADAAYHPPRFPALGLLCMLAPWLKPSLCFLPASPVTTVHYSDPNTIGLKPARLGVCDDVVIKQIILRYPDLKSPPTFQLRGSKDTGLSLPGNRGWYPVLRDFCRELDRDTDEHFPDGRHSFCYA